MITQLTILFAVLTIGFATLQIGLVLGLHKMLGNATKAGESFSPLAAVILCLRGADPFLPNCLKGLLHQDYPRYITRIVVDSQSDPAWQIAKDAITEYSSRNASIQELRHIRTQCSLKCSSLLQALNTLDESVEVIALLDADTIPHATWLRELVAPLEDPRVGATTGNRWYMPDQASLAAIVRYFWNAAAIVLMYWLHIPWGGSLAIKRSLFRDSDLLKRWSMAFCEDTMLYNVLKQQGLRLAFVPSLIMINREHCGLRGFFRWVCRQLLTAKLYHPGWSHVVAHGLALTTLPLGCLALIVCSMQSQEWLALKISLFAFVFIEASMAVLICLLERTMRLIARKRGETEHWLSLKILILSCLALPLLQFLYPLTMTVAWLSNFVEWRGVSYRIDGPWEMHLLQYRPYRHKGGLQYSKDSIET